MSKINSIQAMRGMNWDKQIGSFKPSKRHNERKQVREGVITRRNGKIIRETSTTKLIHNGVQYAEIW